MIVELADGTELEFPDGTSQAQAVAGAKKYLAARKQPSGAPVAPPVQGSPQQPVTGAGGAAFGVVPGSGMGRKQTDDISGKIGTGVANAGIEAYLGGKQLFKDLSPEEMNVLKMSREDVGEAGGFGSTGKLLGNLGVSAAVPLRLVRALSLLRGAAGPAAAALQSGAQAFALTPVEDQEHKFEAKGVESGKAAAAGAAMTSAGKVFAKTLTGAFRPTPDTSLLMDQGVNPTLQQGADGLPGRLIGGLAAGNKRVQDRQEQELLDAMTGRISNRNVNLPGGTANERIPILRSTLGQDYDTATQGRVFPMNQTIRNGVRQAPTNEGIVNLPGNRFAQEGAQTDRILANIFGDSTNGTRMRYSRLMRDYVDAIQAKISSGQPQRVQDALVAAKNELLERSRNSQLSPDELAGIREIDRRYYDLSRLREATTGAAGETSGVNIRTLADKYSKGPVNDRMGSGNTTNDELVAPAFRMAENTQPESASRGTLLNARRAFGLGTLGAGAAAGGLPGVAMTAAAIAPLYGTSMLGQTAGGARFLFGGNKWQRDLKAALRSPQTGEMNEIGTYLRFLRDSSGGFGAAATAGE